jgi:CBS domain-containing protein
VLEGDKVVGIFSERDYARKVYLQGKSSRNTTVRGVMTPDVISVRNDTPLNECMSLMTLKRIRHLPVIEGGRLAGIITVGDVVKSATGG